MVTDYRLVSETRDRSQSRQPQREVVAFYGACTAPVLRQHNPGEAMATPLLTIFRYLAKYRP